MSGLRLAETVKKESYISLFNTTYFGAGSLGPKQSWNCLEGQGPPSGLIIQLFTGFLRLNDLYLAFEAARSLAVMEKAEDYHRLAEVKCLSAWESVLKPCSLALIA